MWGEEGEIWRNPSQLRERFARPKVNKSRFSLSIEESIRLYLRSSSESPPEQHSNGSHQTLGSDSTEIHHITLLVPVRRSTRGGGDKFWKVNGKKEGK